MTKWFLFLMLIMVPSIEANPIIRCLQAIVRNWIITDWPKVFIVENGRTSLIPVKRGVTRGRLMRDFVDSGELTLLRETDTRLIFKSKESWLIAFHLYEDRVLLCDIGGGNEERKKFWLGSTLGRRGILEHYFADEFLHLVDAPEEI